MNPNSFLSVNNLEVVYTQNKSVIHAVNGVSFSLEKGRTLGLVGETGAGKTTIAKAILRILPVPPAKVLNGSILLNGEDLLQKKNEEMEHIRGNQISMIFQDPMTALNPLMTIGNQILEVVELHNPKMNHDDAVEHVNQMLESVGIPSERYSEYPHQFSGGMKQRVVIAMALACNPDLLLADEPTTALDVTIQAQVLNLIKELQKQKNTSMILITHDLGVVAETCDNVAIIYAGHILEYGTKEDIFDHPAHPYTIGLFGSLPTMAVGKKRLSPIQGMPPDPADLPEGCPFWPRCKHASQECHAVQKMLEITPGHFVRCEKRG
jgi:peptide/nickel transport system ATP-binding protein